MNQEALARGDEADRLASRLAHAEALARVRGRGSVGRLELAEAASEELDANATVKLLSFDESERYESAETLPVYNVLSIGESVGDHGNSYGTLKDAIRAMRHLERRAGLRALPNPTPERTYVMIVVPDNPLAISRVEIRVHHSVIWPFPE